MAEKRASMKGKGADIFLGSDAEEQKGVQPRRKPVAQPNQKATFYIPPDILEKLDRAWIDLRRKKRSLTKSELVATAVSAALRQHKDNPKESLLSNLLSP